MNRDHKSKSPLKAILRSPITTIAIFSAAAGLLMVGGIGAARATFVDESKFFTAQVGMEDIGVELWESFTPNKADGVRVSYRTYNSTKQDGSWDKINDEVMGTLLKDRWVYVGEKQDSEQTQKPEFKIGQKYDETLFIKNSGNIPQYSRVTISKYWAENPDGTNKLLNLDPGFIEIEYVGVGDEWVEDTDAQTREREVFWHRNVLLPGEESGPLTRSITINGEISNIVYQDHPDDDENTIVTSYVYEGKYFIIEVTVDAVQTHNADDAAKSAWGHDLVGYPDYRTEV